MITGLPSCLTAPLTAQWHKVILGYSQHREIDRLKEFVHFYGHLVHSERSVIHIRHIYYPYYMTTKFPLKYCNIPNEVVGSVYTR